MQVMSPCPYVIAFCCHRIWLLLTPTSDQCMQQGSLLQSSNLTDKSSGIVPTWLYWYVSRSLKNGKRRMIKQQQKKTKELWTPASYKTQFLKVDSYTAKDKQERLIINFSSKKDTYKTKNLWKTKFYLHFSGFYLVCLLRYLSHESVHLFHSVFLLYLHFPTDINLVYTMQQFVQMTLEYNRLPL